MRHIRRRLPGAQTFCILFASAAVGAALAIAWLMYPRVAQ